MTRFSCCILVVVLSVLESNLGFLASTASTRLRSIRLQVEVESEAIVEVIIHVEIDLMNKDSRNDDDSTFIVIVMI